VTVPHDGTTTERAAARSVTARHPVIITWQGADPPSMESVRLLVAADRMRVSGRMITAADPDRGTEAFSASFEASVDKGDPSGRLLLRTATVTEERQISLSRSEDGFWLCDTGEGTKRNEYGGAIDVDVAGAVTFNALPIRRFGLHRTAGEQTLPVVFISLPDLAITVVEETYRTVSIGEHESVIALHRGDTVTELTVDADGLVVDYPGVARRV
jgi:uncharacterized protein